MYFFCSDARREEGARGVLPPHLHRQAQELGAHQGRTTRKTNCQNKYLNFCTEKMGCLFLACQLLKHFQTFRAEK